MILYSLKEGLKRARKEAGFTQQKLFKELEDKKKLLLIKNGYPADYLDDVYSCPLCRDTGFVNGEKAD